MNEAIFRRALAEGPRKQSGECVFKLESALPQARKAHLQGSEPCCALESVFQIYQSASVLPLYNRLIYNCLLAIVSGMQVLVHFSLQLGIFCYRLKNHCSDFEARFRCNVFFPHDQDPKYFSVKIQFKYFSFFRCWPKTFWIDRL